MPGLCQYRLAKEPDIRKPAAILGKEILADGVFALGSNGNPTRSNLVLVTKAARNKPFDLKELKPLNNMKLKDILT